MDNSAFSLRATPCNQAPVNTKGDFVLYWMTAFRRVVWNFSLDRAADWCRELDKPLLVLESLRCDYPWASDRFHAFILQGMADNARRLSSGLAGYYPFVESYKGEGRGLLETLAQKAAVIVTDDFPCFFLPSMTAAAAKKVGVLLEKVDANGLVPFNPADKVFQTAYHFRRFTQKHLLNLLAGPPRAEPLVSGELRKFEIIPPEVSAKWPLFPLDRIGGLPTVPRDLPIDHRVNPVSYIGGTTAAREVLKGFLTDKLDAYASGRNHPDQEAESRLSPYLHFGHISSHEIVEEILDSQDWFPGLCSDSASGRREGWWGLAESPEAFLDQIITWRELGFHFCRHRSDYHQYESLPAWARKSLFEHAGDPRPHIYTEEEFEQARTHDPIWNAAQKQLLAEGRIHNYLRMLWGKKILHWTPTPKRALEIMINLNNRYALDGRDPNSYTGIFWILGRHDRAWGPERPVFGKVRYMSS